MLDETMSASTKITLLIRRVCELEAEIERLRALTEWQPIETAPKDGTQFLGIRMGGHNDPTFFLIEGLHMKYATHQTWNGAGGQYGIRLTHWMPLPNPPERQDSDG